MRESSEPLRSHLHIAIPAMNESRYLPATLAAIEQQKTTFNYTVYVCVNQPDSWWNDPEKVSVCEDNLLTLTKLRTEERFPIHVLDNSSQGKGWNGKRTGVGQARKTLFDYILQRAEPQDVLISLDADTLFSHRYFQTIGDFFEEHPKAIALSVPYFHPLGDDERANKAILRYEIYMRSYLINLFLIESPFAFTAVGSAIATRTNALKKIGGITPMKSGEDFYLLQKLRKMSYVHQWLSDVVHPAARFSARVFFGTGPAMIKGDQGDWSSYPIYRHSLFEEIQQNYNFIPELYHHDVETPFLNFLKAQFQDDNLWLPLRKNAPNLKQFTKSFHEKADGLRILQYLKTQQKQDSISDQQSLLDNMNYFSQRLPDSLILPTTELSAPLDQLSVTELDKLRKKLYDIEMHLRHEADRREG